MQAQICVLVYCARAAKHRPRSHCLAQLLLASIAIQQIDRGEHAEVRAEEYELLLQQHRIEHQQDTQCRAQHNHRKQANAALAGHLGAGVHDMSPGLWQTTRALPPRGLGRLLHSLHLHGH
jgi:hypothetical protein